MEVAVMGSAKIDVGSTGLVSKFPSKTRFCFLQMKNSNLKTNNSRLRFSVRAAQQGAEMMTHVDVEASSPATTSVNNNSVNGVRLFVGMPMDAVSECNGVNHERAVTAGLKALKLMGVDGVELPVWWGAVEKDVMGNYDWSGYLAVVELVQKMGLKVHVSLCFHGSKEPQIPLPNWVSQIGDTDEAGIYFTDRFGKQYKECLSFAVDDVPVLNGNTPIQVYQAFCESFKSHFAGFLGSTITGVTIGLGPDGELRYPSYDYLAKRCENPGVGEFQCYDKFMLSLLKQHAEVTGNPLWGLGGPHDVPAYDQPPYFNTFFKDEGGSWETPYGDFFLSWYSNQLIAHGERILSLASSVFEDIPVEYTGKLPLIHSWYKTRSHPSELTSGFYNTANRDGYDTVVEMFAKNSCRVILPGMDLLEEHQPEGSSPTSLLAQLKLSCRKHQVRVSGQNLSVVGRSNELGQIMKHLSEDNAVVDLFTYQRMGADFFSPNHFPLFTAFARSLNQMQLQLDEDDMPTENETLGSAYACSEKAGILQAQVA